MSAGLLRRVVDTFQRYRAGLRADELVQTSCVGLGIDVTTAEDGAGWLTFWRSLTARGLSGVKLVTSDAHAGLVAAIGATLPWRGLAAVSNHYATNLMAGTGTRGAPVDVASNINYPWHGGSAPGAARAGAGPTSASRCASTASGGLPAVVVHLGTVAVPWPLRSIAHRGPPLRSPRTRMARSTGES